MIARQSAVNDATFEVPYNALNVGDSPPGDNPTEITPLVVRTYRRFPPHLAHFQAVTRQIRVICKRETHGLAFIIWLTYLKLEIGKYVLIC